MPTTTLKTTLMFAAVALAACSACSYSDWNIPMEDTYYEYDYNSVAPSSCGCSSPYGHYMAQPTQRSSHALQRQHHLRRLRQRYHASRLHRRQQALVARQARQKLESRVQQAEAAALKAAEASRAQKVKAAAARIAAVNAEEAAVKATAAANVAGKRLEATQAALQEALTPTLASQQHPEETRAPDFHTNGHEDEEEIDYDALVRETVASTPPRTRGEREEWRRQEGWGRKEDTRRVAYRPAWTPSAWEQASAEYSGA